MNGTRINQLVAPTSFMTPTSRRLAKMASWIVLRISSDAAISATSATIQRNVVTKRVTRRIVLMVSRAYLTSFTPAAFWNRRPIASTSSAFWGTTRKLGGSWSGDWMLSLNSGESRKMRLNSSNAA